MSMPKGHRSQHGYATVADEGGLGYREIAEKREIFFYLL